jgi:hypothetical protein
MKKEDKLCINYRWLLSIDNEENYMVKNVKIDHVNKKIYTKLYDGMFGDQTTFEWINKISKGKTLKLTNFDECGSEIYSINFHELTVIKHDTFYSYDSSEISIRDVGISYEKENICSKKITINLE